MTLSNLFCLPLGMLIVFGAGCNRSDTKSTGGSQTITLSTSIEYAARKRGLSPKRIYAEALFSDEEIKILPHNTRIKNDLPLLKQDKQKACWVTAGAMMAGWKQKKEIGVSTYLAALGEPYSSFYDKDLGLNRNVTDTFLSKAGLEFERGQSYQPVAVNKMLTMHGPIWFTITQDSAFSQHATIVVGLIGYDDIDKLYVIYVDPADGKEHASTYREYMMRYEQVANDLRDLNDNRDEFYQVIHFP